MMDVVILAGGLGTRLRSVVSQLPKCLAPVDGKPFLWYLLEQLRAWPVRTVVLSLGYLHEAVEEWVSAHEGEYPWEFRFAVETEPLGTGGGLLFAASKAPGSTVVVLNGDTFFDADLSAAVELQKASGAPVVLALKRLRDFDRYGTVAPGPGGRVLGFREKQPCADGLINGGVYVIDTASGVLEGHGERFSFEKEVLEPQCAAGSLYALEHDGFFIDIGVPEDYARACAEPWMLQHRFTFAGAVRTAASAGCDTLLLDRDGVLNRHLVGDYVKSRSEFEWLPGVLEGLREAAALFPRIFVVTNQRGVGKGVMSREALDDVHAAMLADASAAGGRIDGIYVCTSPDDSDPCRKPGRGMFDALLREHPDVNPERCAMIGDSPSDMQFAANCGIRGLLVKKYL